jgi:hypothetical protein
MPVVDINPNNSGTIKLGLTAAPTQEYGCQVINWSLDPVPNTTQRPGTFCVPPLTKNAASSWQVAFSYLQDWGAANSISQFLFDNDAQLVFFEFTPDVDDVPVASGSFYAVAGSYGGDAGTSWQSTGTMAVEGVPVFTAPVALAAFAPGDDTES